MKKVTKIVNKKGFTLVEMMLVVAIVVIMAGVAFLSIGSVLSNSKTRQDNYKNSYIPKVDAKADSVRGINSSRSPKLP